ncbi:uncharacterized protein EI97DRAFT_8519 [Westerdykella ornata]|uniref:Uncharacterized protein n=1 Tax=Westerdykella ornata TaxID=318751 RepID=A0A6A6JW15_WESOR|nr:uncharacterized protein EI97DRAFT_8519 [Westerdykella ornata]KAF2280792.1 hypothetical protein EI97DRAFT_8519 [Westerdykella ornata]
MKTVLIVGGGPAGLVAAKTLLQKNKGTAFRVTIFEAADRVGGMWRGDADGKCAPSMPTNLSRYTVSFADLPWTSVKLPSQTGDVPLLPPMFPKANQVGLYLEEYARRYIPEGVLICNRAVTDTELSKNTPRQWSVKSVDRQTSTPHEDKFDYLIVASGFFDRPKAPLFPYSASRVPRLHSSQFRSISSLANAPGNIVVVGGGISGSEAAAVAAMQISDANHAPGKSKPAWADSKVYHVIDRPFYCLPRFLPQNPYNPAIQNFRLAPDFLPLDLVLYNLSRRGDGLISTSNGPVPPEKAKKGHEFIRSVIGGDQRDLGREELVYRPEQTVYPSYTGISDTYSEFVRDGLIVPVQGRAESLEDGSNDGKGILHLTHNSAWAATSTRKGTSTTEIEDVVGIIEANGFRADLSYLDPDVKKVLNYDPTCHRVPILLSKGSIFNSKVPEMAFVGFYEGPYWGIMEAQARLIADTWSSAQPIQEIAAIADNFTDAERVRDALKGQDLSVPQFWMPDYVGMMEEFSRAAGIPRNDSLFAGQSGPAFPARYAIPGPEAEPSNTEVMSEVHELFQDATRNSRFAAAAAFRAMQGVWTMRRKITSRHPSSPGGHMVATAHFHPRYPTDPAFSAEYLYIEEGTFTLENGFSFSASRRYVYRYNEETDRISTYFVDEDRKSAERIFNELVFERPPEGDTEKGWLAKSDHWCSPDTYKSSCEFRFRGAALDTFGITYEVSGPNKDYTHESWYERPPLGREGGDR